VIRLAGAALALVMLIPSLCAAQGSAAEEKVWAHEQTYWQCVQANDLEHYRSLWNERFLGWPFISPEPARKAHITDWITNRTNNGQTLKSYKLERLVVQVTDNLATTTYRSHAIWLDKDGKEKAEHTRILHTWQRNADGEWQIVAGMSAPVNAEGR
jgi:ketosteroid isomerase-like protein